MPWLDEGVLKANLRKFFKNSFPIFMSTPVNLNSTKKGLYIRVPYVYKPPSSIG